MHACMHSEIVGLLASTCIFLGDRVLIAPAKGAGDCTKDLGETQKLAAEHRLLPRMNRIKSKLPPSKDLNVPRPT